MWAHRLFTILVSQYMAETSVVDPVLSMIGNRPFLIHVHNYYYAIKKNTVLTLPEILQKFLLWRLDSILILIIRLPPVHSQLVVIHYSR